MIIIELIRAIALFVCGSGLLLLGLLWTMIMVEAESPGSFAGYCVSTVIIGVSGVFAILAWFTGLQIIYETLLKI